MMKNKPKKLKPLETATQRKRRLDKEKRKREEKKAKLSETDKENKRIQSNLYMRQYRENETPEKRISRLHNLREHESQVRATETEEERAARLQYLREHNSEKRVLQKASVTAFLNEIYTFCDKVCEICTKRCYKHQICVWTLDLEKVPYLPDELKRKPTLILCTRCKTHVNSRKLLPPSKSYWNNLDPGIIPNVIASLSQAEQRVLSRIIPFVKVIKLSGSFGQYAFRGQAVLFAQDIFEVTEKLSNMLPRSSDNAGIIVITEHLENLNVTREFSISREKVNEALLWLITNNPLYKDVTIDNNVQFNENDIVRLNEEPLRNDMETTDEPQPGENFATISDSSRIVRASWHQANNAIFTSGFAGVQCCAMVLANIVRATLHSPSNWTTNTLNENMIEGDNIYKKNSIAV